MAHDQPQLILKIVSDPHEGYSILADKLTHTHISALTGNESMQN
jgi:hypothetical protein